MYKTSLLGALIFIVALQYCDGFSSIPSFIHRTQLQSLCMGIQKYSPGYHTSTSRYLSGNEEDDSNDTDTKEKKDDAEEREGLTYDEVMRDPELRQMEFDESMKRKKSMFLGQSISSAITSLAWFFVFGGIILNQLGYAWIKSPSGGIGVGTLDQRDFQREMMGGSSRVKGANEEIPVTPISRIENANKHIFNWLEHEQDAQNC